jgi:signal transduction histidine kinase
MEKVTSENILLPLDKELQERLHWFTRLRWVAGIAILIGIGLGPPLLGIRLPFLPLSLVALAVLSYNLILHLNRDWIAATPARARQTVYLQIGLDWAALTFTVYLTGGIVSPVSLIYGFHLIIGAILLSRRACYLLACSASLLLGVLALMTVPVGYLTSDSVLWCLATDSSIAIHLWLGLTLFFLVTTYLATSITSQLREKEDALSRSGQALDRSYQEMESLYNIGQLVNSTLNLDEVLQLIAEHTTRLFGAKACFLRLFDRSGRKLSIGASYGLSQAYINKGPVETEKSPVDSEVLRGMTIQVLEVSEDARFQYREEARAEGLRSMLSCPIRVKNRTLGVIRVYTGEPHVFSEQEQRLLLNLANLGALALQNAHAFGELQALDKEREWFARTTHHQLRSPLAAAQGAIEALPYAGPLNEAQADLLARAKRRIQDSFDTVRDLLDSATAQQFQETDSLEPVRLVGSLRRALDIAREQARSKGLSFEEEPDGEDCLVQADAGDLEKIFSNLLVNAVNYTFSGKIVFGMRRAGDWVEAWVEDTGMGIEPEEQDRIFNGFYRTAAAKATGVVGTGLGLSIVARLVKRIGGTITVDSAPGKGSKFLVRLPTAKPRHV